MLPEPFTGGTPFHSQAPRGCVRRPGKAMETFTLENKKQSWPENPNKKSHGGGVPFTRPQAAIGGLALAQEQTDRPRGPEKIRK